ncbi:hypothetical protein E5288_WYG015929 [Bos mutus]|uniref:Uncharacterized protein n=1 Tax=Bos mutus TaxID=72004 RepID=A0A6B0RH09_9CETA|nr:hypothetical protein [Bos mutus]
MPVWSLSPTLHGTSPQASLCPPPWTSPEHCQKQPLRSLVCAEQAEPKNPSEDRKEVVLSVRSAGEPPIKDTACQTNRDPTSSEELRHEEPPGKKATPVTQVRIHFLE